MIQHDLHLKIDRMCNIMAMVTKCRGLYKYRQKQEIVVEQAAGLNTSFHSTTAGCQALFGIKLGLILGTKIRIFRANLGLELGIL